MTQLIVNESLSEPERERLEQCENAVRIGEKTFLAVGNALVIIRDERLYRETHADFGDYLKENFPRIGSNRRYADYLIEGAKTAKVIEEAGLPEPQSERSLRPLSAIPMEQRGEVWETATQIAQENGRDVPIESDTRNAVTRFQQPEEEHGSLAQSDAYKNKDRPKIPRSFTYLESLTVDPKTETVFATVTRPAVPTSNLKKLTLKAIPIKFQKFEEQGFKIVPLAQTESDPFD